MFGLIKIKTLLSEIEKEIERNKNYIELYKGTKDGAMHIGREIALEEVLKRLNQDKSINCNETTYLINWKKDKENEALEDILISLNKVRESDDTTIANTVKMLLEKYIHVEDK